MGACTAFGLTILLTVAVQVQSTARWMNLNNALANDWDAEHGLCPDSGTDPETGLYCFISGSKESIGPGLPVAALGGAAIAAGGLLGLAMAARRQELEA